MIFLVIMYSIVHLDDHWKVKRVLLTRIFENIGSINDKCFHLFTSHFIRVGNNNIRLVCRFQQIMSSCIVDQKHLIILFVFLLYVNRGLHGMAIRRIIAKKIFRCFFIPFCYDFFVGFFLFTSSILLRLSVIVSVTDLWTCIDLSTSPNSKLANRMINIMMDWQSLVGMGVLFLLHI
jgi:hypothetical protein